MCRSMVDIQSPTAEIRRGKKRIRRRRRRRNRMKIYMVSLLHRATIKNEYAFERPLYFTMGCPLSPQITMCQSFFPSKLRICIAYLDPHLIHGSLGPNGSISQTASWTVQPFLQGSRLTARHMDRPHYSVCNNRPHLHSTALRPNNNNNNNL